MNEQTSRKDSDGQPEQLVNFLIADEEFAIDLKSVREVLTCPEITRLPRAPAFVQGVIDLRGDIIPVIDMGAKLGLKSSTMTAQTAVIIVETEGRHVGAIVDKICKVIRLNKDQITPPVRLAGGVTEEFVRGMGRLNDRLIIILEASKVFSPREAKELAALAHPTPRVRIHDA